MRKLLILCIICAAVGATESGCNRLAKGDELVVADSLLADSAAAEPDSITAKRNDDYVGSRVEKIYQRVKAAGRDRTKLQRIERECLSEEFLAIYDSTAKYDLQREPENRYFAYKNLWQLPEGCGGAVKIDSVRILDEEWATAFVSISGSGTDGSIRIQLKFEDGEWKINNFGWISESIEYNEQQLMKHYVKGGEQLW